MINLVQLVCCGVGIAMVMVGNGVGSGDRGIETKSGEECVKEVVTEYILDETLSSEEFNKIIIENPNLAKERYENIISVDVKNIKSEDIRAEITNVNGSNEVLDYEATLTQIRYIENGEERTYSLLAASTKTSDYSGTIRGVTLTGCIGWVDNLGPINEFKYCSGGRSGSYTGDGYYMASAGTTSLCSGNFSGTSFYATSNLSDQTGTGFRLLVRSTSSQTGSNVHISFGTSLFD